MNNYIETVLTDLKSKNAGQPEFLQAAEEVLTTLGPVVRRFADPS